MTDRELLELAAKAAGINLVIKDIPHRTAIYGKETVCRVDDHPCKNWNPLTDDGDAFRLAVKLKLDVDHCQEHACVYGDMAAVEILEGDDPYAATRLAITRAAAAIGKAMP